MRKFISLFLLLILPLLAEEGYDPIALYLTWEGNPSTTMTIHWVSDPKLEEDIVVYSLLSENRWLQVAGTHQTMPAGLPYLLHHAPLQNLTPNTDYTFRIGTNGKTFKFRTLPTTLQESLNFVAGGDMYPDTLDVFTEVCDVAARTNPLFALVGGDLAYAASKSFNGKGKPQRWIEWLVTWKNHMKTTDGRLIPIIATIGNHDVNGSYGQPQEHAAVYYALFRLPPHVLDFGNYMSIVALDSGHTYPVAGTQATWLESVLKDRITIPYLFTFYHIPAYPSVRKFEGAHNIAVRANWVPLFERYGVTASFEHHDHAYKRTHPIFAGKVDPNGVVYLGDGGWGVQQPRIPRKPDEVWYLAKSAPSRNFISVSITRNSCTFTAIDNQGNTIDSYKMESRSPMQAGVGGM